MWHEHTDKCGHMPINVSRWPNEIFYRADSMPRTYASMKLRVQDLSLAYDRAGVRQRVLDGLAFELDTGSSLALFGPSGSGKTSLLNVIAGLLRPDAGKVLLWLGDGDPLDMASADEAARTRVRRAHLGIVFQFFNLIPTLTLRENCLLPLELNGLPRNSEAVDSALQALGLADKANAFPDQLSGGEQQRVAVLRALAHKPSLVLADEPTGNLDAKNSQAVADLLWRSVGEAGSSLLIATHSAMLAERADRVLKMDSL